jgi:hypothetical protein
MTVMIVIISSYLFNGILFLCNDSMYIMITTIENSTKMKGVYGYTGTSIYRNNN